MDAKPRSTAGPADLRRHSTSSSFMKDDSINAFPGLQRSSSCVSAVSSAMRNKTPQGGLSVVAAAEVVDTRKTLSSIPESSEAPSKKYFSLKALPFRESRDPSPVGHRKPGFFENLRLKLSFDKPRNHERDTFEKICYQLARADEAEVGLEHDEDMFEKQELELKINLLEGKRFTLALPPATEAAGLGDEEEQGSGGTCDQFIGMLPLSCRQVSEKASPLGLVPKLLPYGIIGKEARYVGSCFWIWLCIVDDLTENLLGKEWDDTEADLFMAFAKDMDDTRFNNKDADAVRVSLALRNVIHSTSIITGLVDSPKEAPWRESFLKAVCEVLTGFKEERPLLEAEKISMYDWMRLRAITISTRPFLILARASLGLVPTVTPLGNPLDSSFEEIVAGVEDSKTSHLRKVECMLQLILGLQNDILGWEKDFKTENSLSAIQVLIGHGARPPAAMSRVINAHNELVRRCIQHAQLVCDDPPELVEFLDADGISVGSRKQKSPRYSMWGLFSRCSVVSNDTITKVEKEKVRDYVKLILGFANGMAMWMAVSKRYAA